MITASSWSWRRLAAMRHALELRLAGLHRQRGLVERDVQRHRRAVAPFGQRVGLHHLVGQHGQLLARHVDGGQALARHLVERRVGRDGQRPARRCGRRTPPCRCPGPAPTARRRSRWWPSRRSRRPAPAASGSVVLDRRRLQRREGRALREVARTGSAASGTGRASRSRRPPSAGRAARFCERLRGLDHGLVLGRVLVGLEQDLVELLAHRRRALARDQLARPRPRSARPAASCARCPAARPSRSLRAPSGSGPCRGGGSSAAPRTGGTARRPASRRRRWPRSSRAPGRRSRTPASGANSQARSRSISRASACADAISSAGCGLSNLSSTLAALTLTRLPESSSICIELSASVITRPARNLPASSKRAYIGRRLSPEAPSRRSLSNCDPSSVLRVRAGASSVPPRAMRGERARRHGRGRSPGRARRRRPCRAAPGSASRRATIACTCSLRAWPWPTTAFFICSAVYSATVEVGRRPAPSAPRRAPGRAAACDCGLTLTKTISTEAQCGW